MNGQTLGRLLAKLLTTGCWYDYDGVTRCFYCDRTAGQNHDGDCAWLDIEAIREALVRPEASNGT